MYKYLHVNYPLFLSGFNEKFSQKTVKFSNIKFNKNPSRRIRVVPTDGQADMTNLLAAFRNFANVPEKE